MELLSQVSNTQFMFTAAAVAVVLVCAAFVFVFGFHSAEQPQFGKLPLVLDDKKSTNKKSKKKDKKSSPNRTVSDDTKAKSESSKKSPLKEKKEEKTKEVDKPKPKERPVEAKPVKKETVSDAKKGKKGKNVAELEKPADFDDGGWQEVPKKNEKKKVVKPAEEKEKKKESPKKVKKVKDADIEAAHPVEEPVEETIKIISAEGPQVDEDAAQALQAQVEELQRVLKERERQDQAALVSAEDDESPDVEELTDVKDLRSNKKKENKEKQIKKKAVETVAATKSAPKPEPEKDNSDSEKQEGQKAPVFDELGDTWTDAKLSKKGKKKARKDQ